MNSQLFTRITEYLKNQVNIRITEHNICYISSSKSLRNYDDSTGFHITYNCTFLRKVLVKNEITNLFGGGKTFHLRVKKRKVVEN